MSRITPLMTSLHKGHKAEERIIHIDDMLNKCRDTKYTVLQAFWWYRKYTEAKLQKLEKIEQIVTKYQDTLDNYYSGKPRDLLESDVLRDIKEVLERE